MLQQMAVRHISMFFRCIVIKLHQHLTDITFHLHSIFPARAMHRWWLAIFRQDTELGAVNMERMQHHVANARDNPTFELPFRRRKHRLVHIEGLTVDFISMVKIELPAVVHMIHIAVAHVAHHLAVVHSAHCLIAIFLH